MKKYSEAIFYTYIFFGTTGVLVSMIGAITNILNIQAIDILSNYLLVMLILGAPMFKLANSLEDSKKP